VIFLTGYWLRGRSPQRSLRWQLAFRNQALAFQHRTGVRLRTVEDGGDGTEGGERLAEENLGNVFLVGTLT
jgi:hypothetical protein